MTRSRKMRLLKIGLLLLIAVLLILNFNRIVRVVGRQFGVSVDLLPGGGIASIVLPQGFQSNVFARDLKGPRFMAVGPDGTVYVAEQGGARVSALRDKDGDGRSDERVTVADGMEGPSSVIFHENTLIVGEHNKVSQIDLGADGLQAGRKVLIPDLPSNGFHLTKTVLVGPDGKLYVSIGSTCNICNEADERRAAVTSYNIDGTGRTLYARGLRNAVGLALNPWTQEIWASNNGSDLMGDDTPPETIYALSEGLDAGWPRCHSGRIVDPGFGGSTGCEGAARPIVEMQAHMAPLGLTFYEDGPFPAPYNNSLYVALHGSWNSSVKVGYKVMRVPLKDGEIAGEPEDFMAGFVHSDGSTNGRPAGVTVAADGSLLVSDDYGGIIYRVAWTDN